MIGNLMLGRYFSDDEMDSLSHHGKDINIVRSVVIKRPHIFGVGSHVAIDDYCVFTTQVELGDYIHISPMVSVIGGAEAVFTMGNFTTISAGTRIICASDEHKGEGLVSPVIPKEFRDKVLGFSVHMHNFSSIASNCVISPEVVLGEGAVIGANSFVPVGTYIPSWQIWAGIPVRLIGFRRSDKMKEYARKLGYDL